MTITRVEGERYLQPLTEANEHSNADAVIPSILPQFEAILKSYLTFNILFLSIGFLELTLLLTFFLFLAKSFLLAFSLAVVFLTFFSYFILKVYFQTKKVAQFKELLERYMSACKSLINYHEGKAESHISLAAVCGKLAYALKGREYGFFHLPARLNHFRTYFEKLSYWCHWQDIHKMREFLLLSSIEENIKLVKCEPTNLEVHAGLAQSYVALSELYAEPSQKERLEPQRSSQLEQSTKELLEEKFRETAERAIEEFKILSDFAPHDPWVHAQLAYSYHDLNMPVHEIGEYETLLTLCPDDTDAQYKLGVLYFQQGLNSKGLRMYEQLKISHHQKAEELINSYGNQKRKYA